ncbi:GntR family transcriptional regulator [Enemella sp. A6]|uniref:GntR family transcriptional regulator n=1 Tax=Enemella sp. A6 TaxID=3440152 RepID=UPI003EC0CE42
MSETQKRPRNESQYKVIEAWLEEQCRLLGPGSPLPSEKQLSEKFRVSRMTVRHAMQGLTSSGRIERRQGRGTFVGSPDVHRQESVLCSFSQEMAQRGIRVTSRVLATDVGVCPTVAAIMGLPTDAWVVTVDRVRLADGVPLAREQVFLPRKYQDVLERDLANGSLHEALLDLGVAFAGATAAVTARLATDEELGLLNIAGPAAVLVESRLTTDVDAEVVAHAETTYVGSRWAIGTSTTASPGTPQATSLVGLTTTG